MIKYQKPLFFALFISFFNFAHYAAASIVPRGQKYETGDYTLTDFIRFLINISDFILGIVGSLALLAFVAGGVMLLISGGRSEMVTRGKHTITGAVIGLVIVFSSWTIINFVVKGMGYEGEWYQVIDIQGEQEVAQTETVMQNAFLFTGSFDDIRGLSQAEFETLASSYGIDTSSGLYSFYRNDIYQISQDVVNGNIGSAQELYEAIPWSARLFISQEDANQAWDMISQYQ